jgi:hypothetical protein
MAVFERLKLEWREWDEILANSPDAIVFQSSGWLRFLADVLPGEPVFAALTEGSERLGYLCGLKVKKFGLPVFGSPFRGWSTPYMGFNLKPSVPRRVAAEALPAFAFQELGCLHFEVVDSFTNANDLTDLGMGQILNHTMEIDLTQSEDELLANMTKSCRWTVRKAEKNGVVIEEAKDEAFAHEYSEQLKDVFAKQGLVPHFGEDRVRQLIRHLQPTGMLLMLRARDPEGRCIATGLYPGMNQNTYYWGGASWRSYQKLYPNELLHWHALRYWKSRGMKRYNMVGIMDFKQKFGGVQTAVPVLIQSRYRWISKARAIAPRILKAGQRVAWKAKSIVRPETKGADATD